MPIIKNIAKNNNNNNNNQKLVKSSKKNYKCTLCEKRFYSKSEALAHQHKFIEKKRQQESIKITELQDIPEQPEFPAKVSEEEITELQDIPEQTEFPAKVSEEKITELQDIPEQPEFPAKVSEEEITEIPNEIQQYSNNEEFYDDQAKTPIISHKLFNNLLFQCCMCTENFPTSIMRDFHEVNDKNHKLLKNGCNICNFRTNSNIRNHMKSHRERTFSCNKCNKKFKRIDTLKIHMNTHFPPNFECYRCHKLIKMKKI